MNKKGYMQTLWFVILEGAVLLMFIITGFAFMSDMADGTTYWKNFYARDVALLVDTMEAAPGEVSFNYNFLNTPKDLQIELNNDSVEVYEYVEGVDKSRVTPASFPFAKANNIKVEENNFFSMFFTLKKTDVKEDGFDSKISMTENNFAVSTTISVPASCPKTIPGNIKETKIYFKTKNDKLLSLKATLQDLFKKQVYSEDEENIYETNILNVGESQADIIIVLDFADEDKLEVYYKDSDIKSKSISCITIFALENTAYFNSKDSEQKIHTELNSQEQSVFTKTAIVIKLGAETDDLPIQEVAPAIFNALEGYFSQ